MNGGSQEALLGDAPGVPVNECLRQPVEELTAVADELAGLGSRMGLALPDEERTLLPAYGYDIQAAVGQANAVALSRRPAIQQTINITPQTFDEAIAAQRGLLRVQAGAAQLAEDADGGVRFLRALQGFGCQQILAWIEEERSRASVEELELLRGLTAPLRDFLGRQAQQEEQKEKTQSRRLSPLVTAAKEARADADAMETLVAVDGGGRPADEAVQQAAERLAGWSATEMKDRRADARPAPKDKRRR